MEETMCCVICQKAVPMTELVFVARGEVATPICKVHPHPKDMELYIESSEG